MKSASEFPGRLAWAVPISLVLLSALLTAQLATSTESERYFQWWIVCIAAATIAIAVACALSDR